MTKHQTAPPSDSGFSLIELVVVVAILTIVMGAAFKLMTSSQVDFDRNEYLAEAHENADFAILRVTELVRGAGANPNGLSVVNNIPFISNREVGSSTDDPHVIRILSDLDGDRLLTSRVAGSGSDYYILSSEDVTIKFYQTQTTVGSVTIPANSLCIIDNTPGTSPAQGVPIVLASNVTDFNCTVPTDPREVSVTVTGGPSRPVATNDPRYVTFTRTMQIRLRNRS
jgi:prepilin-type N-terminal cleavage/methylation domain-containing protein